MNPFEMNTGGYDLSSLREKPHLNEEDTGSSLADIPETVSSDKIEYVRVDEDHGQQKPQKGPIETHQEKKTTGTEKSVNTDEHKFVMTMARFFGDGRMRIFIGILIILIAGYMLVASVSYLSDYTPDQSIVQNRSISDIAASHQGIENSAGWFGAFMSHLLMYRWLGLGGFIIIFYIAAIGVGLVKLHRIKFWQLTFKSLVAAIAVSIIAGFVSYGTVSSTFWGGLHGYHVNEFLMSSASVWGTGAVSILMLSALILIFATPLKNGISRFRTLLTKRKNALSKRYHDSMAAARAALEKEAETKNVEKKPENKEIKPIIPEKASFREFEAEPASEKLEDLEFKTRVIEPEIHDPDTPSQPQINVNDTTEDSAPDTARPEGNVPGEELLDLDSISHDSIEKKNADEQMQMTVESPVIEKASDTDEEPQLEITKGAEIEEEEMIDSDAYDPTADLSHYRFPSIDLLHQLSGLTHTIDEAEQEENKQTIIRTLGSYGIEIASIKATVGPTITLYEIVPAEGVRIAKIKRLGDDMTMSLSAIGIRIIAPIPGKGTIGMEVPNKTPQTVSIRSILSSKAYHESTAELPMALGTTISNEVYVTDLAKMPHLLVAGATGMGKSVGLNTIIASLLYKKHPAELKFVLVDPKMVEFSLYKCLEKHFLAKLPDEEQPIITDPTKVVATLNSICLEMDNRYDLLSKAGTRGIKEYNHKFISRRLNPEKGHRYLPYIVVVIDEFADLIMTAGKEIEMPIARIAQKARAVGIHMILATQRPSVNVITGMIKANFPGRIAFRVTQMNDSRTIIDRPGAEQLIGRGDMLISRDGVIERVQCAFIDTDEVEAICKSISEQIGYTTAYELPEVLPAGGDGALRGAVGDRDPMFADAGREVIASNMGSASLLQRKFNIGYPRAGKLIDQLEAAGVVGAASGAGKPRPVLMDMYAFEQLLSQS